MLELNDKNITQRLKTRKIDPVSGNIYENNGDDAETQEIFNRL